MIKKLVQQSLKHIIIAFSCLCVSAAVFAQAAELKSTAPERYVVKKGDTLWDISGMYLDEPWRWPELWVKNAQIENPHLIYPGDVIVLSFVEGQPVLSVERSKQRVVLTPTGSRTEKANAIDVLPWEILRPYVSHSWIVESETYETLPKVLGNSEAAVTFANDDLLLTRRFGRSEDQYYIARDKGTITDMSGNEIGYQLNQVASAEMLLDDLGTEWLVRVVDNKQEVVRGDLLWNSPSFESRDLELKPAKDVRGHVVSGLHDYAMYGKFDVVIVDLGSAQVSPGTVLGIYDQGPNIVDDGEPRYVDDTNTAVSPFDDGTTVIQPAIKFGEIVIFSVFDKASYGLITRSEKPIRRGFIAAEP